MFVNRGSCFVGYAYATDSRIPVVSGPNRAGWGMASSGRVHAVHLQCKKYLLYLLTERGLV